MVPHYVLSSLTRITELAGTDFGVEALQRDRWALGDYVVAEVLTRCNPYRLELANGRMLELAEGDLVVGALGDRYATLEAVGSWGAVGEDGEMEILGGGGILGKCTSRSLLLHSLTRVRYRGHVVVAGAPARMRDYAVGGRDDRDFDTPTVLIIGTSMSAGKTTAARVIVRILASRGLAVLGAKLTGAGRYRDILAMEDAGADRIFDFVDAGLPSTVVPERDYIAALGPLLSRMASVGADVAVIEAGASPLEPYNGEAAVAALRPSVACTVLCASDPYAVLGVMSAFDASPDVVTGPASNTEAAVALVRELTGREALNVLDPGDVDRLEGVLSRCLGLPGS